MLTAQQHDRLIDKIKGLSELELDELLHDIADHLNKSNLRHLIDNSFQVSDPDYVDEIRDELAEMEEERDALQRKIDDIGFACTDSDDIDQSEDDAIDEFIAIIDRIKGII